MTANQTNPAEWLDLYGDALYRFALLRVHDEQMAEDLVQETLLAGLKACERFAGKASEKTWLTGILKHKIVDYFRKSNREIVQNVEDPTIFQAMETCFDEKGHWRIDIGNWPRPDQLLQQDQFLEILSMCVERLPPRLGRLFVLRDLDGVPSDEICEVLGISTTNNLWVMLSRMRLQLRNCLDIHWFGKNGN